MAKRRAHPILGTKRSTDEYLGGCAKAKAQSRHRQKRSREVHALLGRSQLLRLSVQSLKNATFYFQFWLFETLEQFSEVYLSSKVHRVYVTIFIWSQAVGIALTLGFLLSLPIEITATLVRPLLKALSSS